MNSFAPFWWSFLAAAVVAGPIYKLLLLTKSRQKIDPHAPETHQRKQGTPTMGGLIIVVGALVALALMLRDSPRFVSGFTAGTWILLLGFAAIGFVDDFVVPRVWKGKRGLGWKQKILLEFGIAGLASHLVMPAPYLAFWVTFFLILFFSNAYNFADGLDGLAGTVWLALALGLAYVWNAAAPTDVVVLAISGATVVFLFLNAPPAKVFMGDVGSLPIGALLGWCIAANLWSGSWNPAEIDLTLAPALLVLSIIMIAELVPVPMQVAYFKLTKGKRLFPMTPIHHAFEKVGWPETRVVFAFALTQLLLSLAAISFLRVLNR